MEHSSNSSCKSCGKAHRAGAQRGLQYKTAPYEIKATGELGFGGLGSTFEDPENHDTYGDIVAPETFDRAIKRHRESPKGGTKILWQHDPSEPMGVPNILAREPEGLRFHVNATPTQPNRDRVMLIDDGAVDAASIGFEVVKFEFIKHETPWGSQVRRLLDVDLWEISPVTFPANRFALLGKHGRHVETRSGLLIPTHHVCTCDLDKPPSPHVSKYTQGAEFRASHPDDECDPDDQECLDRQNLGDDTMDVKSPALVAILDDAIDAMVNDDTSRGDVINELADSAGISASTMSQILRDEVEFPPLERLEGFASVLGVSLDRLIDAVVGDGANPELYGREESSAKSGRIFSSKNEHRLNALRETLMGAVAMIDDLLEQLAGQTDNPDDEEAADEEASSELTESEERAVQALVDRMEALYGLH